MDQKKALYRAKLKAQKQQDKRIDSPLIRYNESDLPVCKVCDVVLKSDSAWTAHQISAKHRQAIKNVKEKAAAATLVDNVKSADSTEHNKAKPEHPAESYQSQTRPPQAQSTSALPSDFFDNPGKKIKQNETSNSKLIDNAKKKTLGSVQAQAAYPFDGDYNKTIEVSSGMVSETVGAETQTQALPEGFFDDKDADLRARGIAPAKLDIKDEYKEFEKLIQEDLKEVDNRLEEEEYDAAEMIEEAETVEQKSYRERVEMFKRKKMELKAARSAKRVKEVKVVEKESSVDESSSDEDSDDAVDWRAKHL
ncbi:protein ABA AND ROS SENSITIVE 1-like [Bidens hawaiensis]|uniref:protein ABA AND ROS SENSITIVE 1-like n=1 Tax=Bidens hawaiensis TaxID=980011 RepID=UPI00404A96D6